jgi:DNA invertase Pin-like site-specific DNA recombinase
MPVMPHARRGNDDRRRPLNILGGLAEFERTLIRARTSEGRERAKPRGVRFGRPKKLCAHQRWEALDRINAGEAVAEVARASWIQRRANAAFDQQPSADRDSNEMGRTISVVRHAVGVLMGSPTGAVSRQPSRRS